MARFYDSANESDLKRIEELLKKGGIEYSLRPLKDTMVLMQEIDVAEEDLAAAERILYNQ